MIIHFIFEFVQDKYKLQKYGPYELFQMRSFTYLTAVYDPSPFSLRETDQDH